MNVLVLKKHLEFSAFQFQPLPSGGGGKERESGKKNPLSLLLLPPSSRKVRNGFPLLLPPHTFFFFKLPCDPLSSLWGSGWGGGGEKRRRSAIQPHYRLYFQLQLEPLEQFILDHTPMMGKLYITRPVDILKPAPSPHTVSDSPDPWNFASTEPTGSLAATSPDASGWAGPMFILISLSSKMVAQL